MIIIAANNWAIRSKVPVNANDLVSDDSDQKHDVSSESHHKDTHSVDVLSENSSTFGKLENEEHPLNISSWNIPKSKFIKTGEGDLGRVLTRYSTPAGKVEDNRIFPLSKEKRDESFVPFKIRLPFWKQVTKKKRYSKVE